MLNRSNQAKRISLGLLPALLVACGNDRRSASDPQAVQALSELQDDFNQLKKLIDRKHPKYFTDDDAFEAAFAKQYAMLRGAMNSTEFLRIVAPAVSNVDCGHPRLSFPPALAEHHHERGNFLPFEIRAFSDGSLYVMTSYYTEDPVATGSALLSINEVPAPQIVKGITDCLPADGTNETYKQFVMNTDFKRFYHRCIDSRERFTVVVVGPNGEGQTTKTVPAMSLSEIHHFRSAHGLLEPHPPRITTSFLADPPAALLRIGFFGFDDEIDEFSDRVDRFFLQLAERGTKSLILDLRGNDGGEPRPSAYLLGYLLGRPFRYFSPRSTFLYGDLKKLQPVPDHAFTGDPYVLIDGGSYSTTGHFLALLAHHGVGTFIGVESGGSYACNGGYKEHRLRHTGIEILLPHTTFIADVRGLLRGRGIPPDHWVEPTIHDLLNGKDPAMESAIALIRHQH